MARTAHVTSGHSASGHVATGRALTDDDLAVRFQPVVDVASGTVIAYEAVPATAVAHATGAGREDDAST
ncbi:hypothetical protein ACFEMC_09705 [Kineococcus sp. DHX-1]|uniref:hypothetical protein n=1 Tax=Kineococcus sp. DHX-1 TaxID=3349638 RepID=UPI0036D42CD6